MATNTFIPDGSANYDSWKDRIMTILEENDHDDLVLNAIEEPTSNDGRVSFKKKK